MDENGSTYEEGEGLRISGYDDVTVANGTVIGHESLGYGLRASDADRLSLRRVSTSGYGSLVVSGDAARIVEVAARGFAVTITSSGATIDRLTTQSELDVFGQAVVITNGDFRSFTGLHVDGSSLRRNHLTEGWLISGNGNSIVHNQGGRWWLNAGGGNTVRANHIPQGLVLSAGSSDNLVRDNLVGGDTDGIFVAAGAAHNMLEGNSASGSADDGIDVEDPSTKFAGNRAFGNADLGIEAVTGVIDGGGNRAWDNGNPLQCVNVDCG